MINGILKCFGLTTIKDSRRKMLALREFAIWMTGCGYDFPQHKYFCEQRDKLLKG